jgi:hypothetical protein
VTVQHVTVTEGGQAIVGGSVAGTGRDRGAWKWREAAHERHPRRAPQPALHGDVEAD